MTKPRLFKRNGLWMARLGDRLAVGNSPREAYYLLMRAGLLAGSVFNNPR